MAAKKRTKSKKRLALNKSLAWWMEKTKNDPKARRKLETMLRASA